ncbi:MAG: [FeFe] hydrogenase H-cluster radical SAM maturase HydE [Bacteroidales bacterium]|jgi:biotin synthase|nr:[FeFe] hydrogenase H-cluster radical SAM maturase HydE [Bacteroidales bacterium]
MKNQVVDILNKSELNKEDIVFLLNADPEGTQYLFNKAHETKLKYVGKYIYFRGLIELSNVCSKNCYYCGIRRDNKKVERYSVTDEEVIAAATYALNRNWGSIVIQSGERQDKEFINRIENLLKKITSISEGKLGITLSLGEQKPEVYKRWHNAGATRYLLRIETSDKNLFYKMHPEDTLHDFEKRIQAIYELRNTGYMAGTGVMIGLPYQTTENLANDLLFMKNIDIDMCGMGPYLEHEDTPLWKDKDVLLPVQKRYELSLKMIAILRIIMKDINIASSTALQAIDPHGREEGIKVGANVIMPNITPVKYHSNYNLYKGKPEIAPETDNYIRELEKQIETAGGIIGYGFKGDPLHFNNRKE